MTNVQSDSHAGVQEALVGICTFGGMVLLLWAGSIGSVVGLGLAVGLWVVGGVLSVGLDDEPAADPVGDTGEEKRPAAPARQAAGAPDRAAEQHEQSAADALETLRERYARGELTEAQFERRVERLLATDGAADDDAVRTLRTRYARGELSDEQFERKLERLTGTRTLEEAADNYEREESSDG